MSGNTIRAGDVDAIMREFGRRERGGVGDDIQAALRHLLHQGDRQLFRGATALMAFALYAAEMRDTRAAS